MRLLWWRSTAPPMRPPVLRLCTARLSATAPPSAPGDGPSPAPEGSPQQATPNISRSRSPPPNSPSTPVDPGLRSSPVHPGAVPGLFVPAPSDTVGGVDDQRHGPAEWLRVPVGEQSEVWSTARFERSVLVAARTLTITLWGLDFLDEVLADSRVQMLFSVDDKKPSAFWRSAASLLRRVDAATVPWSQATSMTFDLAVSFSFSGSLDRLRCPLMLGLHGASLGKYGALPSGGRFPLPRLSEARDDTAPTTVVIPHRDERARYGDVGSGVDFAVAGDPCLDRLLASVPRRNHYRRALGVESDQRLVAVSSTWGPDALLATMPDIATLLTAALPADEYRVALIIHPNIWTGHSGWQVRAWLKRARDAGVLAIAPWTNAWRGALVASDVVVHDHGSVALYAAALDKPLLTVPVESDDLIGDSLTAELGRRAPTLDANRPLRPQIDAAMAGHDRGAYQDIAGRVSSCPGESLRRHRDLIYRLMRLEAPPVEPRVLAVDLPPERLPSTYSHHVCTAVESGDRVVLQRFPAATPPPPPPQPAGRIRVRSTTSSRTPSSPTLASRRTQPSSSSRWASTRPKPCWTATRAAAMRLPAATPAHSCATATARGSGWRPEAATPPIRASQPRLCTHLRSPAAASATASMSQWIWGAVPASGRSYRTPSVPRSHSGSAAPPIARPCRDLSRCTAGTRPASGSWPRRAVRCR